MKLFVNVVQLRMLTVKCQRLYRNLSWMFGVCRIGELSRVTLGGQSAVNTLTLFGLFAVTAMLVTYALESRSTWYILAFAGSCALGSAYGFLQGAWPFGVVEAIWAVVAVRRWYHARQN